MTGEASPIRDAVVGALIAVPVLLLGIGYLARREKTEFKLTRVLGALLVGSILFFGPIFLGVAFMEKWRRAPFVGIVIGFAFMYSTLFIIARKHKNQKIQK